MDLGIKGNVAIITASSSGLGKASAIAMVKEGVNVLINGRDKDKLDKAVKELNALNGGEVIGFAGDLTNKDDIKNMVDKTYKVFGRIDHLITSAGGPPSKTFKETNDNDWYFSYDLLVMSVVWLVRESLEYLEENDGGTIVNITSRSVKEAIDGLLLSNSVRMSVIGLMKTLSKELGPNIRVNAVLSGPHETDRLKNIIKGQVDSGKFDSYQDALKARSANIPLGRIGKPSELGEVVTFLSSNRSSYLNGLAIPVDGGSGASNL